MIEFKDVTKIFNQDTDHSTIALNHLCLQIEKGDFVAVMGPSGSGKTTLLNVMTGALPVTSGTITVNGQKISEMSETDLNLFRAQCLGFIYQDFHLLNSMTIYENLALPLARLNYSRKEIRQKINTIANKLDIAKLYEKYPIQCSGGQRQRVVIARAMVTRPSVLVADEPTGNLDLKNSQKVMCLLKEFHQKETTLIVVTHDCMVASYADRVICLKDGNIENQLVRNNLSQEAFYKQILQYYASDFWQEAGA